MKLAFYADGTGRINLSMDQDRARRVGGLVLEAAGQNDGPYGLEGWAVFKQSPNGNKGTTPPGGVTHRWEFQDRKGRKNQRALSGEAIHTLEKGRLLMKVQETAVEPLEKIFA